MKIVILFLGLILLCIACAPSTAAVITSDNNDSGPGWYVNSYTEPILDPSTGLPYTSEGDMDRKTTPDHWNSLTPEEKAREDTNPAPLETGGASISYPALDITDEEIARIIDGNMTTAEVYAWLAPDFWAAYEASGFFDPSVNDPFYSFPDRSWDPGPGDEQLDRIIAENMTLREVAEWLSPRYWEAVETAGLADNPIWDAPYWVDSPDLAPISSPLSMSYLQKDGTVATIPLDSDMARSLLGEVQWKWMTSFSPGSIPDITGTAVGFDGLPLLERQRYTDPGLAEVIVLDHTTGTTYSAYQATFPVPEEPLSYAEGTTIPNPHRHDYTTASPASLVKSLGDIAA